MRIVVVNGERGWEEYLAPHEVVVHRVQDTHWVLRNRRLFAIDRAQAGQVDGVLWRVGAIRPDDRQRTALEVIRLSGVPCVNSAAVLLRNFDRLGMLSSLREAGLPAPWFDAVSDTEVLERVAVEYPRVLKVGGLHGGFGKAKVDDPDAWGEIRDLAFAAETYATVEPFIPHKRDVRCLLIGDAVFGMERRGRGWRANVDTIKSRMIDPPPDLERMTRGLARHLGATLLAVDALETDGGWVVMESNETPGLSGFPDLARVEMARLLLDALAEQEPPAPAPGSG